jgi:hypothetical protein
MKIALLPSLLLAIAGSVAHAECVYPRSPANVPDGRTATSEQMLTGMKEVKEYNELVTAYLACLDEKMNEDITQAGPEATPEVLAQIKAINAKRHNAAIEALESHAARFNEQVRTFKNRDKEKSSKS